MMHCHVQTIHSPSIKTAQEGFPLFPVLPKPSAFCRAPSTFEARVYLLNWHPVNTPSGGCIRIAQAGQNSLTCPRPGMGVPL